MKDFSESLIKPAQSKKRILARCFDLLIFICINVGFYFFFKYFFENLIKDSSWLFILLSNLSSLGILFIYQVVIPFFTGASLGKFLYKLRFIHKNNNRVSFLSLLVRESYLFITPLILIWSLFFVSFWIHLPEKDIPGHNETLINSLMKNALLILTGWWAMIFLLIQNNHLNQLFYDRYFGIFIVDLNKVINSSQKLYNQTYSSKSSFNIMINNFYQKFPQLSLNKQQEEAVISDANQNLCLIAGPGTGKTTVLVARIAYLIEFANLQPEQILALTFTKKATENMRSRLKQLFDQKTAKNVNIFTYHAFGLEVLNNSLKFNNKDFNKIYILDQTEKRQVIKILIEELSMSEKHDYTIDSQLIKEIVEYFDLFQEKNLKTKMDFYQDKVLVKSLSLDDKYLDFLFEVFDRYREKKDQENWYDFVDLLVESYNVLKEKPNILASWRKKIKYMLIDEFQDTNTLQYRIVSLLTKFGTEIPTTVVGDPDQTIYGWRDAKIEFILNFEKNFFKVKTIKLIINYRSGNEIIDLSNQLIMNNNKRIPKELIPHKTKYSQVVMYKGTDIYDECYWLVKKIKELITYEKIIPSDIVVLYRVNYLSMYLERNLIKFQINYGIVKGQEFFKRTEIKEFLTILSFIKKPTILNTETLLSWGPNIGFQTLKKFKSEAKKLNLTLLEYFFKINFKNKEQIDFQEQQIKKIFNYHQDLTQFSSLQELAKVVLEKFYKNYLIKKPDIEKRLENLKLLIDHLIIKNDETHVDLTVQERLDKFLINLRLNSSIQPKNDVNKLQLMTIHNAKGLEFKYVFLFHVTDDNFPNRNRENDLEEERRLLFVAITRTKNDFFLTTNEENKSLFIEEIMMYPELKIIEGNE